MNLTKKEKEIIIKIHKFVKKESIGFSEDDVFKNHIINVRDYSVKLAKMYKANIFVVEIAAYLHDIYHLQTKNHKIHEIEGAKFAKKLLTQYDIPKEEIELICKCILNHRGSKKRKRVSVEEKIVSCADAMDHINRFQHMFYRKSKKSTYEELIKWMHYKIERGWNKIELSKAKDIIRPKYEIAKIIFEI